jgi:hypothetical protein
MTRTLHTLLVLCFLAINTFAQPGSNDPTFNPTDIGYGFGDGTSNANYTTAQQPDGKIIIAGKITPDFSGRIQQAIQTAGNI